MSVLLGRHTQSVENSKKVGVSRKSSPSWSDGRPKSQSRVTTGATWVKVLSDGGRKSTDGDINQQVNWSWDDLKF